jgi:RHS repeat-associated protein
MLVILPGDVGSYSYAGIRYANPHAVTSVGGTTYTYDNDGNVTAIGSLDYTWDWRNRLSSAERSGGGITTYGYDHTGQRVFTATGSATTSYPNRYYNVASSSLTATTTKHIFSPDGTLLATVVGSGTSTASTTYLHPDHLGGTNVATDEDGEVAQTLDYYPYGSQRIAAGLGAEQRRFIGEEYDGDTEFSYLNARYYQGSRAQFMSEDPVFLKLGTNAKTYQFLSDPQTLNAYAYSQNNPIILVDKKGEFGILGLMLIGAGVGVVSQGISDYTSGAPIMWQNYAGAASGGAVGSLALIASLAGGVTFAPTFAGATSGAVDETITQSLKILTGDAEQHDWKEVAKEATYGFVLGGVAGKLGPKVSGISSGRNSMSAISSQITTKISNGSISNFTVPTASKILTSQVIAEAPSSLIKGALDRPSTKPYSSEVRNILTSLGNVFKQIGL